MNRILFFSLLLISLVACKKKGCTDNSALNYDIEARRTDHSCIYRNWNSIYWAKSFHDNVLVDSGSVTLSAYVNNQLVGSLPATSYIIGNPDCNSLNEGICFYDTIYYREQYKMIRVIDEQGHVFMNKQLQFGQNCHYIVLN